jgi:hypothetical protein
LQLAHRVVFGDLRELGSGCGVSVAQVVHFTAARDPARLLHGRRLLDQRLQLTAI